MDGLKAKVMTKEQIKKTTEKKDPTALEMKQVVEQYIFDRKNTKVNIDLMEYAHPMVYANNDMLLFKAYLIAKDWYENEKN